MGAVTFFAPNGALQLRLSAAEMAELLRVRLSDPSGRPVEGLLGLLPDSDVRRGQILRYIFSESAAITELQGEILPLTVPVISARTLAGRLHENGISMSNVLRLFLGLPVDTKTIELMREIVDCVEPVPISIEIVVTGFTMTKPILLLDARQHSAQKELI